MSGNSKDRRRVRRRYERAGLAVPNAYRRLGDKVVVLGVAEHCAEYGTQSRIRWGYVLIAASAGLVGFGAAALA